MKLLPEHGLATLLALALLCCAASQPAKVMECKGGAPAGFVKVRKMDIVGGDMDIIEYTDMTRAQWVQRLAKKCLADCKCKGFNTRGYLKDSTCGLSSPSNISSYCLFLRIKEPKRCQEEDSPPPIDAIIPFPSPPPTGTDEDGCKVCITVSAFLNQMNQPMDEDACGELLDGIQSARFPVLDTTTQPSWTCSGPQVEILDGNRVSTAKACSSSVILGPLNSFMGAVMSNMYITLAPLASINGLSGIGVLVEVNVAPICGVEFPPIRYLMN